MLAIISDLHLQHTAYDVVRFRSSGDLFESGVVRNISAGALQRFFRMVHTNAKRHGSDTIELIFAGDIFEIHRTPLWLYDGGQIRPIDNLGQEDDSPANNPLMAKVLEILDAIEVENKGFFDALERLVKEKTYHFGGVDEGLGDMKVKVHYIPGNHDRLANAWEPVRRRIRKLLSISPANGNRFLTEITKDFSGGGKAYGVRIRHGHQYDRLNTPLTVSKGKSLVADWDEYIRPCFGDYITVDVGTRIASSFRVFHAAKIRDPGDSGKRMRNLYGALTELDDVRPEALMIDYLSYAVGASQKSTFQLLRPVLRDLIETALDNEFLRQEAKRLGYWNTAIAGLAAVVREGVKNLSAQSFSDMINMVRKLLSEVGGKKRESGAARIARYEPDLGSSFGTVVAGHTHHPKQVPLPPSSKDDGTYYLDSGTWRTILPYGEESFGRLRAYTMIFCYSDLERQRSDGRRFECWTGHIVNEEIGPQTQPVPNAPDPDSGQNLRFTECKVIDLEETRSELELQFGMDDKVRSFHQKKVRRGDNLDLSGLEPLSLDPGLDGELWFHGIEKDLGNILNPDDPLPWAFVRLPRIGSDPSDLFQPGPGHLKVRGWGAGQFDLEYVIEE